MVMRALLLSVAIAASVVDGYNMDYAPSPSSSCEFEGVSIAHRSSKYIVGHAHKRGSIFGSCDHGRLTCYEDSGLADAPLGVNTRLIDCDARTVNTRRRKLGVAINLNEDKWPNGLVWYRFSTKYPLAANERDTVKQAMKAYEATDVAVTFQECEPTTLCNNKYVDVSQKEDACYSYVGFTGEGGGQILNLGKSCFAESGTTIHELGHVLGLYHEHTHPERQVIILTDSNLPVSASNYAKETDANLKPYDKASIMHYGRSAGLCLPKDQYPLESFCDVEITTNCVMPKKTHCNNTRNSEIGQRTTLSEGDLNTLKSIYGTRKSTPKPTVAPSTSSPVPSATTVPPSPSTTTPAPSTTTPAPSTTSPPPTTTRPPPATTAPTPTTTAPSPTSATPTPTPTTPQPTSGTPKPPVPTTTAPSSTPTPTTPTPTTEAPKPPVPTTAAPSSTPTASTPAATTPAPTTPVPTTLKPVPTTAEPVPTSSSPAPTTPSPNATSSPAPATTKPSLTPPTPTAAPSTDGPTAGPTPPPTTQMPPTTQPSTVPTPSPETASPYPKPTQTMPPTPPVTVPTETIRPTTAPTPPSVTKRPAYPVTPPTVSPTPPYNPGSVKPGSAQNAPWWQWWNTAGSNRRWADKPWSNGNGKWWPSFNADIEISGDSDHGVQPNRNHRKKKKETAKQAPAKKTRDYSFRGWGQ